MTDELKQLAVQCRERLSETVDSNQEERVLLEAFREVQRQTVEAAAWSPYTTRKDSAGCCVHCKQYMDTSADIVNAQRHSIDCPIRALLSPAQEDRNG